jgi:hypothetical protein
MYLLNDGRKIAKPLRSCTLCVFFKIMIIKIIIIITIFYYFFNFKFNIALIGHFILTAKPRCHALETTNYFCNKEEADLLVTYRRC